MRVSCSGSSRTQADQRQGTGDVFVSDAAFVAMARSKNRNAGRERQQGCGDHRHREMCGDGYEQSSSCGKTGKCSREKSELRTDAQWFCVLRTGIGGPHRTSCPAGYVPGANYALNHVY